MNNSAAHQKLVGEIMLAFGSKPNVRVFPRRVGLAIPVGSKSPIYFGFKGQCDIEGIVAPRGFYLCIEVKTGDGKLSKEQKIYRDVMLQFGAIYIEARDVESALREFEMELASRNA